MAKRVLLVDPTPDRDLVLALQHALPPAAEVEMCSDFRAARTVLLSRPPDLLITNLRLGAYNGLHLVLLAGRSPTRCVVYATTDDLILAREVQAAGAFYERAYRLLYAIPSYLNTVLPQRDRRNLTVLDRRLLFRGGRRCTDRQLPTSSTGNLAGH